MKPIDKCLCGWAILQIACTAVFAVDALTLRAGHALFLLGFTFLIFSRRSRGIDFALAALAVLAYGTILMRYNAVAIAGGQPGAIEYVAAAVALLTLLEAARRAAPKLALLAAIFLAYNFFGALLPGALGHGGFTLARVLRHLFWGSQGVFGVGLGVSATYIFVFMLFGAFLKASGFTQFAHDLALAAVGRTAGGPAKVSVLASALMGMMNGSAVANVATTGTLTIPMMKKTGFSPAFAAAVEAVASTGGQFTPPVMGAVGFLMAEFLGVSYRDVMLTAAIPAALYYASLLFAVHFEAKRLGLSGLSKENLPRAMAVLRARGHLLLPLVVLIGAMLLGFTPLFSAVCATVATVIAAALRKETRMPLRAIFDAAADGARAAIPVGVCCAVIGVIIGTVSLTGVGQRAGDALLALAGQGNSLLSALLAAVLCCVLGMGVPGVAAYVIVISVAAPALIGAGAEPIGAHLFCLFYACLSNITPPVAISAYVASGIAGADQTKTALAAVRLGAFGFLLPFFFLRGGLLLPDVHVLSLVIACAACVLIPFLVVRGREMIGNAWKSIKKR